MWGFFHFLGPASFIACKQSLPPQTKSEKLHWKLWKFLQQTWEFKVLEAELTGTRPPLRVIQPPTTVGMRPKNRSTPYSKRHQRRLRQQQIQTCSSALSTTFNDRVPYSVSLIDPQTKQMEQVLLGTATDSTQEVVTESEEEQLLMMLYIKDKYHVSGQAYHELAQLCKLMPRHYKLKRKIAELNSLWNLSSTPEGTLGVQQKLEERLRMCLEKMIDGTTDVFPNNSVRVKLTADGTRLGKHLSVVNFAFTILEEGPRAYAPSGNHCIAILKEKEDYDSLKIGLKDIIEDVRKLESITVQGKELNIVYYLGGDLKFLATVTGIGAATSNYACVWCKCPALERHDCSQVWSISDTSKGARTIEETKRLATSKRRVEKYNVKEEPLFDMIPLVRVVVDNLHMFLRVADVLIDLLLLELRRLDCIDKANKIKSLDGLNNLKLYQTTLKMIGISGFEFYIGHQSQKLKWRTLTGPEKLVLFRKINIPETFPRVPSCTQVQSLWKDLLAINTLLSARPDQINEDLLSKFEADSKQFLRVFVSIYPSKHVTPYMHCMAHHVSEFFKSHGAILQFTQQGLEKYNDHMTKDYFRSSSHRGVECLKQILQKQMRLEHLESNGAFRTKATTHCGECGAEGHNRRTCPKQTTEGQGQ